MATFVKFNSAVDGKRLLIDVETIVVAASVNQDTTDLILVNGHSFRVRGKLDNIADQVPRLKNQARPQTSAQDAAPT
jgi:hypothetical protein